jgi:hypothetical protein
MELQNGDCVRLPDGRIGRVRDTSEALCVERVRRTTSKSHQFLKFHRAELTKVDCPKGWMTPDGYNRYLKVTLAKMKLRKRKGSS